MDEMSKEREDHLQTMLDRACKGVMDHIAQRIKDVAKRAYYLGCQDGMEIQRNKEEKEQE